MVTTTPLPSDHITIGNRTSSSAVAKRPRDASYLSVVSFNSTKRRVESLGPFTATQPNSTRLTCYVLIGCTLTLQLGQLHCRSSATVELSR